MENFTAPVLLPSDLVIIKPLLGVLIQRTPEAPVFSWR